jgi:hypothetical protein
MRDDMLLHALQRGFLGSTAGFGPLDYIHARGSPLDAWMYTRLFWPDFVEMDDMVFLKGELADAADLERVRAALRAFGGDKRKTQESLNTVEIAYLFGQRRGELTVSEYAELVQIIATMWRSRLEVSFPNRQTQVVVIPRDESQEAAIAFFVE